MIKMVDKILTIVNRQFTIILTLLMHAFWKVENETQGIPVILVEKTFAVHGITLLGSHGISIVLVYFFPVNDGCCGLSRTSEFLPVF